MSLNRSPGTALLSCFRSSFVSRCSSVRGKRRDVDILSFVSLGSSGSPDMLSTSFSFFFSFLLLPFFIFCRYCILDRLESFSPFLSVFFSHFMVVLVGCFWLKYNCSFVLGRFEFSSHLSCGFSMFSTPFLLIPSVTYHLPLPPPQSQRMRVSKGNIKSMRG